VPVVWRVPIASDTAFLTSLKSSPEFDEARVIQGIRKGGTVVLKLELDTSRARRRRVELYLFTWISSICFC
jgi:hypothetical protein